MGIENLMHLFRRNFPVHMHQPVAVTDELFVFIGKVLRDYLVLSQSNDNFLIVFCFDWQAREGVGSDTMA